MGKVFMLDENTIAGLPKGDIINRPADMVKELIENALDAGANIITVEINNGGITYIKVSDNGCGIEYEDFPVIFQQHTTSKNDKTAAPGINGRISGFMGMSLASISPFCEIELTSRPSDRQTGGYISYNHGHLLDYMRLPCSAGTEIVIANLYFNYPLKYKRIKNDAYERALVMNVICRFCLEYPKVSFTFISNNECIFVSPGNGNVTDCISSIYGKKLAKKLNQVEFYHDGITVEGWTSGPDTLYTDTNNIFIFINNRYIKNPKLYAEFSRAYREALSGHYYPFAALFIKMPEDNAVFDTESTKTIAEIRNESDFGGYLYKMMSDMLHHAKFKPVVQKTIAVNAHVPELKKSYDINKHGNYGFIFSRYFFIQNEETVYFLDCESVSEQSRGNSGELVNIINDFIQGKGGSGYLIYKLEKPEYEKLLAQFRLFYDR